MGTESLDVVNSSICSIESNVVEIEEKSVVVTATKCNQSVLMEESSLSRRVSARLSGKKRPYYGSPQKPSSDTKNEKIITKKTITRSSDIKNERVTTKKITHYHDTKEKLINARDEKLTTISPSIEENESGDTEGGDLLNLGGEVAVGEGPLNHNNAAVLEGKSAHVRVKETIRLFTKYYLLLVQEEEQRCKKVEVHDKNTPKGAKSKKGNSCAEDAKRSAKRPDLKAVSKMIDTKAILYPKKRFGDLPGVDVGHRFYSRAEMVAVGFHGHWLNGIDYMGNSYAKLDEHKDYKFPIAVSIVLSGMYEDDQDNSEDVVYTGQGGNNLLGDKRQISDQVMKRGNLALKNNMEQSVPVRVIRGHECTSSYCGKVYTYDGLYKIINYWAEKGASGFTVFKYRLRRLEKQPPLTTNQVQFIRAHAPKSLSEIRGLVCEDISGGEENVPIPATNLIDDPPVAPMGYTYCKSIQVVEGLTLPRIATGCNCKGTCTDPRICACAKLNGSDFPYVHKDGGRLIEAKAVVFECGPKCGCGPGCVNRTSQRGLKYRLEVFRTPSKGWAVRSWDFIPSGAPVCEYTGQLMRANELDNVSGNDFIFEIDCLQTMKGLDGRESRPGVVSIPTSTRMEKIDEKKSESVPEFCIDAGAVGGVARFINHSCEPNLFVQCVLSSHHDIKLARVMLFAADNIPPLQEFTYDYGYALDSVMGPDGKIKVMPCYCGATGCRKRLY